MAGGASQFLIHVEVGGFAGDFILERSGSWQIVYQGAAKHGAIGKVGNWTWDTSRDYCLLYDDRAGTDGANRQDRYIVLGLKFSNPGAATFGFEGVSALGYDKAGQPAPRGSWEIVATPDQLGEVKAELEKLHQEITDSYKQIALDVIGCVDPTPISDGLSAAMALRAGDYIGASLSLVAIFPYIGDALGKSAKFARALGKVRELYNRLRRVMKTLQVLDEGIARARRAAAESMARLRRAQEEAKRLAAAAERRVKQEFFNGITRNFKHTASRAGWRSDDLARACEWAKFTDPPKFIVARRRSEDFVRFEGKAGFVPKPMDVKLKSAKSGPNKGLVVKPSESDLADIVRREGQGSADSMRKNIKALEQKGYKFDHEGVLIDPRGNKIYSDVDFMGIYNVPKGRAPSAWGGRLIENDDPIFVDWINDLFFQGRKTKQHGNQDRFTKELEGAWQDTGHVPGRVPDADELKAADAFLVITPDGLPHNVNWNELSQFYKQHGIENPYHGHV